MTYQYDIDIACISTMIQTFAILQCVTTCTTIESVVWINIISNGIFSAIVQGCDNFITFARYAVVLNWKISRERYILTSLYVIVGLYFCWWPFFTIAPFIADMNTVESLFLYQSFQW